MLWGIGVVLGVVAVGLLALQITETRPVEDGASPRVLLVGDSLLNEAATSVRVALAGMRVVDATLPGSGLLTPREDWTRRLRRLVARVHPNVVVASFIGNVDRSESRLSPNSRAYYLAWNRAASRLAEVARHSGARIYWVAQPPVANANFYGLAPAQPRVLSTLYRHLARHRGSNYVDGSTSVANRHATFVITTRVCGKRRTIRLADGVHFTAAGAAWWGIHVATAIAHLERQHVDTPCHLLDLTERHGTTGRAIDSPTDDSQELRSKL